MHATVTQAEMDLAMVLWYALDLQGCEERTDKSGSCTVSVFFISKAAAETAAAALRDSIAAPATVSVTCVVNEDWNAQWRNSMEPALLAPSYWVSPLWLTPKLQPGDQWIKIEPKMAFGTGHHETTRLAAQALISRKQSVAGGTLLDIGTGSGVLCFVAATLGAAGCYGVELDTDCRENLAENRTLNDSANQTNFVIGSTNCLKAAPCFSVIVMNMIHTESAPLLSNCTELLQPAGELIWSGILADESQQAIDAAREVGFKIVTENVENEWWCGVFTR